LTASPSCAEAAKRTLGQRHFDVQMIAAMVLHEGDIAEMRRRRPDAGCNPCVYLNALAGKGVHVVPSRLPRRRDSRWMGPDLFLGLTVGVIVMGSTTRRKTAYAATSPTAQTTYGFDYLRDNMKYRLEDMVQRGHFYASSTRSTRS